MVSMASKGKNSARYRSKATDAGLARSCHDCSEGGIAVAAAEMAFAGGLGMDLYTMTVPRPAEVDRVESWVNEAFDAGTEVLSGAKRISDSCYECTVLFDPPASAKVSELEVFGPVICVYPYADLDDAIWRANSLPLAFQAAVFTRDVDTAMYAYNHLDGSAIMVNDHTAFRVDWMPFAGLKHSGLGVGGIPHTIHDMQIEKMLVLRSPSL